MVRRRLPVILCFLLLSACGIHQDGPPSGNVDVSNIPNAVPKVEARSRYGNPPSYTVFGKTYYTMPSARNYEARGIASWYGTKFHGKRTSSGEPYNMLAMTAAHKTLPLPSYVKVVNLENGREIIVKVNDRGPFKNNRIIDLSYAAAKKLGMTKRGTAMVDISVIDPRKKIPSFLPRLARGFSKPRLYLQLGAFASRANAQSLRRRLQTEINERVILERARSSAGNSVYRVQIGPLASVSASDNLNAKLQREGFGSAWAVVK